MSAEKVILLLGRRDQPTDGVADYCEKLREAGAAAASRLNSVQFRWAEKGWRAARLRSCARPPPAGAIAGFFCNTRRWHGRAADFLCARRAFSKFLGNAARVPASCFTISCRADRFGNRCRHPRSIASCAFCGNCTRVRISPSLRSLLKNISWLPARSDKAVFIPVGPKLPGIACQCPLRGFRGYKDHRGVWRDRRKPDAARSCRHRFCGEARHYIRSFSAPARVWARFPGSRTIVPVRIGGRRTWRSRRSDFFLPRMCRAPSRKLMCCSLFAGTFRAVAEAPSPESPAACRWCVIPGRTRIGRSPKRESSPFPWATARRSPRRWKMFFPTPRCEARCPAAAARRTKNIFRGPRLRPGLPRKSAGRQQNRKVELMKGAVRLRYESLDSSLTWPISRAFRMRL